MEQRGGATPGGEPGTGGGSSGGGPTFPTAEDSAVLAREAAALRRERAVAGRRRHLEQLVKTRRWHRYGLSGPLVALCLLPVAVVAALLLIVVPAGTGEHPAPPTTGPAAERVPAAQPSPTAWAPPPAAR